jgi:membrane protease YdiL (CAAX protease family)
MQARRLSPVAAVLTGLAVTAAAVLWFAFSAAQPQLAVWLLCPGAAFTAMLLLGSDSIIERMRTWFRRYPASVVCVPVGLWAIYLIYSAGMGILTPFAMLVMASYLALPFAVLAKWHSAEPLIILWIWLPLELGIVRQILVTHRAGPDLHYALAQLLAIDAGIVAFVIWNQTPNVGYRFEYQRAFVRAGLVNFCIFAVIAIPLGFAIHFIHYSFTLRKLYIAVPVFAGIFLFTALPEEFLFRGLIQNWIERTWGRGALSLLIASLIFGASHLNNGPPIPNYRYFLMATIAGIFYGRAWRSTGSLMASSLTHALVDTIWSVVFR